MVTPEPPLATGKVPVARAEVDVAYKAPFKVNELKLVPPLAVGNTPLTPVVKGSPVALVNVPDDGVPKAGVTNVGDVLRTTDPVPVEVVTPVPPYNTATVVPCHVPELTFPNALTLPLPFKLTDFSAG